MTRNRKPDPAGGIALLLVTVCAVLCVLCVALVWMMR